MRLKPKEVEWIKNSIKNFDPSAKIFLYGSQTQDQLRGGDLDLIVLSEHLKFTDKLTLLAELKSKLGDQKIDLTICTTSQSTTLPFISQALNDAVML